MSAQKNAKEKNEQVMAQVNEKQDGNNIKPLNSNNKKSSLADVNGPKDEK